MLASTLVYLGLMLAFAGLILIVKPIRRLRVPTRRRALAVAAAGVALAGTALALPAPESRASRVESRLDEFAPAWQFREHHTIRIAAPPSRAYANSPPARRRFAAYWRVIYPGSAIIRRMWLRAIERRAREVQQDDEIGAPRP